MKQGSGKSNRRRPAGGAPGHAAASGRAPAGGTRRQSAGSVEQSPVGRGRCAIAGECGACPCIGEPYALQLARKDERVHALFMPLADAGCSFEPIAGMADPWRFRDKIASPFAPGRTLPGGQARAGRGEGKQQGGGMRNGPRERRRDVLCGMYAAGTHRIVSIADCPVENAVGRKVVASIRRMMLRHGMEPYDEDAGTGFIRHVVVRVGHESGEVLVTVVTNGAEFPGARNFCRELVKACPQVTTVVQNVNTRQTNAILGREERVLYGPGFILDTLCGLSFRISSHSFYQVNAVQTEVLYRIAIDMARDGLAGGASPGAAGRVGPSLVDAYCGTGTIGLVAASLIPGAQVVGVDNVESAIRDARLNARHNGIENARFETGDAGSFLARMAAAGERLDVLMMDPPRAGASREFMRAALAFSPERIVYISCNPETQARDARILRDGGYRLVRVRPVDMFPHTDHVECVAMLDRSLEAGRE